MSDLVWRFTNNGTALASTSALGQVAANAVIHVPANLVAVNYGTNGEGATAGIYSIVAGTFITGVGSVTRGTGGTNIASAELVANGGFGKVIYSDGV